MKTTRALLFKAAVIEALSGADSSTIPVEAVAGEAVAEAALNEIESAGGSKVNDVTRRLPYRANPHVAHRMLALYDDAWMRWPSGYAVAITAAALNICERLDPPIPSLRCRAQKEAANALVGACRFDEALAMLDRAAETAKTTLQPDLHLGAINMARARAYVEMRKPLVASGYIVEAKAHYFDSCQPWRVDLCRAEEAIVLWEREEYARTREIFVDLYESAEASGDAVMAAVYRGNVAGCDSRLGNHERARLEFHRLLPLYGQLGLDLRRALVYVELGRMTVCESGRMGDMVRGLKELDRLGATSDWVQTQLLVAEEMARRGDRTAVLNALHHAYRRAVQFHMKADAATALDMLRQQARDGEATPETIRQVAAAHDFRPERPIIMECDGTVN